MSTVASRKQASRPARPAVRYWKGKAPKGVADVESDSDAEDALPREEEGDVLIGGEEDFTEEIEKVTAIRTATMNVSLKDVSVSRDGRVIVAGRQESGRTVMEVEESEEEEEEESDEGEKLGVPGQMAEIDEMSVEDESSSEEEEEEEKTQLQFRPVFVPKRVRVTVLERDMIAQDNEEAQKKKELQAEERRKQSHDLVAETIKRELAENEKEELIPDVDDTDGLDPTAEFEAWRLRELGRIKRDKEEEIRHEQEREEIERRRALPEEQRLKEDLERATQSREDKPKGKQKFLQKYWHKGAFHQDEEILKRHDYTEATESVVDVSLLPKVMQVKNFGKRSRTKYTHLLDQDTTVSTGGFGGVAPVKTGGNAPGAGGCFLCGGPHLKKDCPQNVGPIPPRSGSGANAVPTAPRDRRTGRESGNGSWRDRDESYHSDFRQKEFRREIDGMDQDRRGDERPRDRGSWTAHRSRENGAGDRKRSPSRSRSRSPPRGSANRDGYRKERRRSRSADRDYNRDKKRRLD